MQMKDLYACLECVDDDDDDFKISQQATTGSNESEFWDKQFFCLFTSPLRKATVAPRWNRILEFVE